MAEPASQHFDGVVGVAVREDVAILSPGEMGSQVARSLSLNGLAVVTCVEGRGEATRARALAAGMACLPSLDELVRRAGLVVSVVPPAAALPVAERIAEALGRVGSRPLYLDANAVGPDTARAIGRLIEGTGGRFVDGAIIGAATRLREKGRFLLSGTAAAQVAEYLEPALRVQTLGPQVGQASAFKVLYAGLTKGMSALGVELLAGAQRSGVLEPLWQCYREDHPSVVAFWEHTLPGLPRRATRRAQEMSELHDMLVDLGLDVHVPAAAQATLAALGARQAAEGRPDWEGWRAAVQWWGSASGDTVGTPPDLPGDPGEVAGGGA